MVAKRGWTLRKPSFPMRQHRNRRNGGKEAENATTALPSPLRSDYAGLANEEAFKKKNRERLSISVVHQDRHFAR